MIVLMAVILVAMMLVVVMLVVVVVMLVIMTMVVMIVVMIVVAMAMMGMIVVVMVVIVMVIVAAIVVVGSALRLEGTLDGRRRAALAAHHLGEDMVLLDVDRVGEDFGGCVPVADMPGDAQEPQRVLGPDLEEALRGRLHLDEPPVVELDGVAVGKRRRLVEIEQEVEAFVALECDAAAVAALVIEGHRIGDALSLDGWLADDGDGAEHEIPQNKKYRCASGSTVAGSQTRSSPSAVTR
jgi:hypothetical protein